jgi:FkbM family methyltransferase
MVDEAARVQLLRAAGLLLGALPEGSGQHRVVSRLYRRVIATSPVDLTVTARLRENGGYFTLNLSDFVQAQAFLNRRYDSELVHFIRARVPFGGLMVDVGAHIGLVAVQVARERPNATVHAFEPFPNNVSALKSNVERNELSNVIVNAAALSDRTGSVTMTVASEGSNWHYVGGQDGLSVDALTLDDYARQAGIDRIDVLKVDVEGHEPSVLRGAGGLLRSGAIRTIVAEIHDEFKHRDPESDGDLVAILGKHGYRMAEIPGRGLHRFRTASRNVYRNVFFELRS